MDLLVISRYRFPVDNIVESLHIIGAQIFIFQVVSVFPDIDARIGTKPLPSMIGLS